jgi:uncharacterized protein with NRDE domain
MCLILIAYRSHPEFPLVVAANRDEFHARPTTPAHWWDANLLAGKDEQSGGTWLGVTRTGRLAAVTNYHEGRPKGADDLSRGQLVVDFLRAESSPAQYLGSLEPHRYAGFGLVVSDLRTLGYFSNRADGVTMLQPGFYGLSNHLLDTDWPKVDRGKRAMRELLEHTRDPRQLSDSLLELLGDRAGAPERERAIFVLDPVHGTRCSTVVTFGANGEITLVEQSFGADGKVLYTSPLGFRGVFDAMAITPAV